jgi:hypothetical protein
MWIKTFATNRLLNRHRSGEALPKHWKSWGWARSSSFEESCCSLYQGPVRCDRHRIWSHRRSYCCRHYRRYHDARHEPFCQVQRHLRQFVLRLQNLPSKSEFRLRPSHRNSRGGNSHIGDVRRRGARCLRFWSGGLRYGTANSEDRSLPLLPRATVAHVDPS